MAFGKRSLKSCYFHRFYHSSYIIFSKKFRDKYNEKVGRYSLILLVFEFAVAKVPSFLAANLNILMKRPHF